MITKKSKNNGLNYLTKYFMETYVSFDFPKKLSAEPGSEQCRSCTNTDSDYINPASASGDLTFESSV